MSNSRLEEIRSIRIAKFEKLKQLGVNPYPSKYSKVSTPISQSLQQLGDSVSVVGRLMRLREHGNIFFADLRDQSGQIQLLFQKSNLEKEFSLIKLLDAGDFVGAAGKVIKTQAGETTIDVESLELLSKSIRPLPDDWTGLKDEETRYRQRYVDLLINPDSRKVFDIRSKLIKNLRKFLDDRGFQEVETPILQPIYGGASAQPFTTHHNALDNDFYLRISDELYLKRLVVGGMDKVYEIGHDFRNEGVDREHNPEFTQLEFYWGYADYEMGMDLTQELIKNVLQETLGTTEINCQGHKLDFSKIGRITFRDVIKKYVDFDIDEVDNEEKLLKLIKQKKLDVDLKGVVGYGNLIDKVYKRYARANLIDPVFLTDYPVEIIALAKRHPTDPKKISSFQLLAVGFELIKAYSELNDPVDQKNRWIEEEKLGEKGLTDHMVIDEDYIRALEYGMPPTFGWGMGIDRFISVITDQPSLKDTILFPTLRPETK